jgi:hypothetical protein
MRMESGDQEQRAPSTTGPTPRARKGPPRSSGPETRQAGQQREQQGAESPPEADEAAAELPRMPLGIVAARIFVVSSLGFAAAVGIFLLIGGFWELGLAALAVASVFVLLMFVIERLAQ